MEKFQPESPPSKPGGCRKKAYPLWGWNPLTQAKDGGVGGSRTSNLGSRSHGNEIG